MHLTKHHGLGNDFLVALDDHQRDGLVVDGALALALCDRRRGLGADGLIHGATPTAAQAAQGIDVVMHLFNADGSRAEMSGNGIRCLGQAVAMARELEQGTVTALTDAGVRALTIGPAPTASGNGRLPAAGPAVPGGMTVQVQVGMGVPGPGPHVPDPVAEFLPARFATVDMGNPHLVIAVPSADELEAIDLTTDGAWLERQFPQGVNVEYITARPDRSGLTLRVWERGAGITEACGTGACAATLEAHRWGLVDRRVQVAMPGGDAEVVLEDDGSITLIGPATFVAHIEIAGQVV